MRVKLMTLAATAMLAAGCASGGGAGGIATSSTEPLAPVALETTIEVRNNNWSDMVVYAMQHTTRTRLGLVTSMNTRQFELPVGVAMSHSGVQLVASPIGSSRDFVTGLINVLPGQRVELQLENAIEISNWAVW